MNTTDITRKFTAILVAHLGCYTEEVTPDAYLHPVHRPHNGLNSLGADSLDLVEITMAVEEEFGIDIPDEEAEKLLTVQDWITHLENHPLHQGNP